METRAYPDGRCMLILECHCRFIFPLCGYVHSMLLPFDYSFVCCVVDAGRAFVETFVVKLMDTMGVFNVSRNGIDVVSLRCK